MPRKRSISRTNNTVRLFVKDKMHIKQMVEEFKKTDPRYDNEATAIRYFVHLGISAQQATENLRNSLDNTIVKHSIKQGLQDELKTHTESLDKLVKTVNDLSEKTDINHRDLAKRQTDVESKLETLTEGVFDAVGLLKLLQSSIGLNSQETLRNVIVLRTILYVFLLGYQTERILPDKDKKNAYYWAELIRIAHERANELSINEVQRLSAQDLEANVIVKMAEQIFKEILSMQQPQFKLPPAEEVPIQEDVTTKLQ